MAKIGLPKGSGKRLKVREKSVKSQGILKWILSGNPVKSVDLKMIIHSETSDILCVSKISACMKVFGINPEFRILRLTFHRKSASKARGNNLRHSMDVANT